MSRSTEDSPTSPLPPPPRSALLPSHVCPEPSQTCSRVLDGVIPGNLAYGGGRRLAWTRVSIAQR